MIHIGYTGPVVAEPFNRPLQALSPGDAAAAVSEALDLTFALAKRRMLPQELIGSQHYATEALEPTAGAAGEAGYSAACHSEWHRLNQSHLNQGE